jgi:hypothetical protein
MKRFFVSVLLTVSTLSFAQQKPVREIYSYTPGNDAALVKAKTDLFLLDVVSSGRFTVEPISSGTNHLDLNLVMPVEAGKIKSRVRYDFMKEGFVVSLSNSRLITKDNKTLTINNEKDRNHQTILNSLKNLVFKAYEKEIYK